MSAGVGHRQALVPGDSRPGCRSWAFGDVVRAAAERSVLIVQPRMGFGSVRRMRQGLVRVRQARALTVGTITVDSYTRLGREDAARVALSDGADLNGFPITSVGQKAMGELLNGIHGPGFPIQVRHGSPQPQRIVASMIRAGLDATEGGPVSYCLPYGRYPLRYSVDNWKAACDMLSEATSAEFRPHIETFGGCLLGQLCPPSLLVAVSVLEALFFCQRGLRSISLSYAQQTNGQQDELALEALRRLASELIPPDVDWHIVVYTYMGLYPRTPGGALELLEESARLARRSGAARLIVKSAAEAHRIPTIEENVEALEAAAAAAAAAGAGATAADDGRCADTGNAVYMQALALIHSVLALGDELGKCLVEAVARGYLDIPYCLHPDNARRTRSYLDPSGWLRWSDVGSMAISGDAENCADVRLRARELLTALSYVRDRYDRVDRDTRNISGRVRAEIIAR